MSYKSTKLYISINNDNNTFHFLTAGTGVVRTSSEVGDSSWSVTGFVLSSSCGRSMNRLMNANRRRSAIQTIKAFWITHRTLVLQ